MIGAAILAGALLGAPAARPQHGAIDSNETLFTVMSAINVAGYNAELDSPTNHPLRRQIREHLTSRNLPSVEKLKRFYEAHTRGNPTADLSQYISFALLVGGPPDFQFRSLTYELPPDAQALDGFGPILAEFYREAEIPDLYQKIQPAIEEMAARYQTLVSESLFEINGYLRNPTSGVAGRSFQIVLCLMGAPNQVQTRSYSSDYVVVVTPSVKPQISDIRYTYLHYVLEPAMGRAAEALERLRPLGDYALGAPYLAEHYKQDFQLLATSSLIKAIEARLAKPSEGGGSGMVEQAYRQGFILTPFFAEQLPAYEKQDKAMRLYLRDMLEAADLALEEARARTLEFDQKRPVRAVKPPPAPEPELSAAEQTLQKAEDLYSRRDLEAAREHFLRSLRETRQKPLHSRAYFGLARIATLKNDPELAILLFERALGLSPEPADRAWILVYLGRLSDVAGEADKAGEYYREALAVGGASETAREMARKGAAGGFRK